MEAQNVKAIIKPTSLAHNELMMYPAKSLTSVKLTQGSYRQDCLNFKDFSKTFLLFSRTEKLRKILIYTLKC